VTAWAHVEALSELLGHASVSFTLDRYGHLYRATLTPTSIGSHRSR
jgi:site-specific recombinase XerD